MAAEASHRSQIIEVAEIAWVSMMPNIKAKILWSDPAIKRRAQFTRFERGTSLPIHPHVGDELLYVIEGSNFDESGELRTGNVSYFANGCTHTVLSKNGHTAMAFVTGDSEVIK
jgi:anti-sigma factor ChrR (cupin superfamily)